MTRAEILLNGSGLSRGDYCLDSLLSGLRRLDHLLEQAIGASQIAFGQEAAADPYRGLYISQDEVKRLLAREPGAPGLPMNGRAAQGTLLDLPDDISPLSKLKQTFDLSPFDLDVLLVALAPELDLRYERLYAYLQDDVTRRRPTVDLALNLLCSSREARLARRTDFGSDAPLLRHGLLHLVPDPHHVEPPLLAHYLKVDDQIISFLLGQQSLDFRLVPCCRLIEPTLSLEAVPLDLKVKQALPVLVRQAWETHQPLQLYFYGPPGAGKRHTAEALANMVQTRLLVVDVSQALTADLSFTQLLKLLFREAQFKSLLLYFDGLEVLYTAERSSAHQQLLEELNAARGITILAAVQPWTALSGRLSRVISISFPIPAVRQRQECWQTGLEAQGIPLDDMDVSGLAGRFRLTSGQIASAIAGARNLACWRVAAQEAEQNPPPFSIQLTIQDLFAAARAQSGHDLALLAHKVEPTNTWSDIVLPDDALAQLHEICQRVAQSQRVLEEWGFRNRLSLGKGVNALFAGPSGTGKTMAAEIIAHELGLDLYKVNLSGVVSKYIGETEKNLDRIFSAAEHANAILFFDEADALFGKRSEVHDSHDRYANIEISYLLQKMEHYEGIALLATNLRGNLDDAFLRRLAFTVHFPFPDEASRRRIWAGIWPTETPLAGDVDLDILARQFKLSGGNIKNIALAAAFLAAADGAPISMAHVLRATQREYQKLGKQLSASELGLPGLEAPV